MSFSEASVKPFKDQVYDELKSQHDESNLFEDPYFRADNSSLYYNREPPRGVRWLRPREFCEDPQFVVDGYGRGDMDQGYLGNCWFIAASVGLLQVPKIFNRVIPQDQSFSDDYSGIFHFRFWLYGQWVDVVIDDRLPVYPDGKLVFCSNKQRPNELWGPLLEKAYAKLYGCYENLEAGQTYDALIDMSGGIQEQFDLKNLSADDRNHFWEFLCKGFAKNSIMGCSINADPSVKEARLANGLVRGHAYTITHVEEVEGNPLIRIRNPWGNEVEWKGAWSDNSGEWGSISQEEKDRLDVTKSPDGEFWMSYSDFMRNWDNVQICHLSMDSFSSELLESDNDSNIKWNCTTYQSGWKAGENAGGCGQGDSAAYWTNPQFIISLADVDSDDNENMATIVIALMQKDTRLKRAHTNTESAEEFIQFRLFKVHDDVDVEQYKSSSQRLYAGQLERIGSSGSYINSREVTKRYRVQPGNYLIIPSTYEAGHSCDFMLRIFTEHEIDGGSLDEHKPHLDDEDVVLDNVQEDFTWKRFISKISPKVFSMVRSLLDQHGYGNVGRFVNEENFHSAANSAESLFNTFNNIRGGNFNVQDLGNTFNNLQDTFSKFKF